VVGSCRCYLEVLEQDARAGDGGCCYLPTWEQDAKMVGEFGQEQRKTVESSVLYSAGLGEHERWSQEVDLCVRDRSVKEKQQIWFGIARLDTKATAEAGLSWLRLPLGRIRHCGCRRGELGVTIVDLK
ncbi:hypothetical protein GW17_00052196, partial [Ensete ventricosum]